MVESPFIRQLTVASAAQLAAFSGGGAITFPSVLLQQLKANDSTIELDIDTASSIGSIQGLSGICSIIMPVIMQWRGRKFAFLSGCLLTLAGWAIAVAANSITAILFSEAFHGLGSNSLLVVSISSLSEMVGPKYRNVVMMSMGAVQALGMALVGSMVRYVHWKTISAVMILPMVAAMVIASTWLESPSWLACKGEFERCEQAFKWLRGSDDASMNELKNLIAAQKENIIVENKARQKIKFLAILKRRDFYLPSIQMFLLLNLMYWSGSAVVLIYCIDMIRKATGNDEAAYYGGIIINLILFIGVTISSVLVRFFKNKSVLLPCAFAASFFQFCNCLINLLQNLGVIPKDSLLGLYMLLCFMIPNCLGLNSIVFAISLDILPVKYRNIGGALYIISNCVLLSSSLKLSPYLFEYIGLWGTFLIFAVNGLVCGVLVCKYVPETNGKTLQEIEDFYTYGRFRVDRSNGVESTQINGDPGLGNQLTEFKIKYIH